MCAGVTGIGESLAREAGGTRLWSVVRVEIVEDGHLSADAEGFDPTPTSNTPTSS